MMRMGIYKNYNAADIKLPTDGYQSPDDIQRVLGNMGSDGKMGAKRPVPTAAPDAVQAPKVGELIDVGWVTRDEKGGLKITPRATAGLDGTTQEAFRLLADMFVEIMAALEEKGVARFVPNSGSAPE